MQWRVHLAYQQLERLPLLLGLLLGGALLAGILLQSWLGGVVAILLLVGATREFLFPVSFRMNATTLFADGFLVQKEMLWKDVKRVIPEPNGVRLSPLANPSRLDSFRGISLYFAPDGQMGDKTSVLEMVQNLMIQSQNDMGETS